MKFGKSLNNQIEETVPEWRDKFISYKDLKKSLKRLEPKDGDRSIQRQRVDGDARRGEMEAAMSADEIDFIRLLEDELEKFNSFFVDKEEDYVIRLKEFQDRMSVAKERDSNEEIIQFRKEIVDFHGEMVLLENYSALNYIGLVKILKKFDKRTGALMRFPFIQKVLKQPFSTTDLLFKLVKECEKMLDCLFPLINQHTSTATEEDDGWDPSLTSSVTNCNGFLHVPENLEEIKQMQSLYMKSTISALKVLKEIRGKSSTVSAFSLPPLNE